MEYSIFSEEGSNFRRLKKDDLDKYQKRVLEVVWFKFSNKNSKSMRCNTYWVMRNVTLIGMSASVVSRKLDLVEWVTVILKKFVW